MTYVRWTGQRSTIFGDKRRGLIGNAYLRMIDKCAVGKALFEMNVLQSFGLPANQWKAFAVQIDRTRQQKKENREGGKRIGMGVEEEGTYPSYGAP